MNIRRNIAKDLRLIRLPNQSFGIFSGFSGNRNKPRKIYNSERERIDDDIKTHEQLKEEQYYGDRRELQNDFHYGIQVLKEYEKEALMKNPHLKNKLQTYIDSYKKEDQAVVKDFIKKGYLEEVTPMSFKEQKEIIQILAQEKGEESDYDSDVDVEEEVRFNRRLFNYIKIQDQVELPQMRPEDEGRKTLFIEIDDLLIHTFIPDENIGYVANSASKDPDRTLFLEDARLNILYYERDNLYEFLEYIDKNFEPILFTSSQKLYADYIVKQFDPEDSLFRHKLYQNSCYMLEKKDEDIFEFIKDINQFIDAESPNFASVSPVKRSAKNSLLLDTKPLSYILNPSNVIPCEEFTADYMYSDKKLKDMFLNMLMEDLEEFKEADDVRKLSRKKFRIIDNLYSSKLV
ncbi:unnamed protein product [Moneuplotes crassus]|uniref:Mitochondrial import inner membrane translocase subunit TIM50 n=2 Tax=Euplotes crassus TaxID=5936 RepID=A0AAD1UQH4_EUPCR|nr:unnamed protein product [Moneuplotes crassus]